MGFSVTGGAPDFFGAVMIVLCVAGAAIFAFFILRASKSARDQIIEEQEDHPER
jgi:hypothetical protein